MPWAWEAEAGTSWEGGKLVPVQVAQENALKAIDSAKESIDKSNLDEEKKEIARKKLAEIREQISKCFTERKERLPRGPTVPTTEEGATSWYLGQMNEGDYAVIEYLEDKVEFRKGGGGPAKAPEAPKEEKPPGGTPVLKIDVPNEIVIDGFEFNKFDLPEKGKKGRDELELLCTLPNKTKAGIEITRITGHTDVVPVTKPGPRFKSLEELSKLRIEAVKTRMKAGGFDEKKLPKGEPLGASQAKPNPTDQERKEDRKVVVYWKRTAP